QDTFPDVTDAHFRPGREDAVEVRGYDDRLASSPVLGRSTAEPRQDVPDLVLLHRQAERGEASAQIRSTRGLAPGWRGYRGDPGLLVDRRLIPAPDQRPGVTNLRMRGEFADAQG